ncbi:hypothetical protein E2C01_036752 [Portunus trituberculatus]|uniref:Uncharacterized protein n=1 Tax=Portunus trituberculatus TaxID=210409 RepID=A0A5B7FCT9_PORTR|nr:hypothetical protein [Portunus trituberculatus]
MDSAIPPLCLAASVHHHFSLSSVHSKRSVVDCESLWFRANSALLQDISPSQAVPAALPFGLSSSHLVVCLLPLWTEGVLVTQVSGGPDSCTPAWQLRRVAG